MALIDVSMFVGGRKEQLRSRCLAPLNPQPPWKPCVGGLSSPRLLSSSHIYSLHFNCSRSSAKGSLSYDE